jgi:hypothetical protein
VGRVVGVRLLQKTIFQFCDNGERHIEGCSAQSSRPCLPTEYDNSGLSRGKRAFDDHSRIGSPLVCGLRPAADAVAAGEWPFKARTLTDDHAVRRGQLEHRVNVMRVERVDEPAHAVNVLLRHRPRIIAGPGVRRLPGAPRTRIIQRGGFLGLP